MLAYRFTRSSWPTNDPDIPHHPHPFGEGCTLQNLWIIIPLAGSHNNNCCSLERSNDARLLRRFDEILFKCISHRENNVTQRSLHLVTVGRGRQQLRFNMKHNNVMPNNSIPNCFPMFQLRGTCVCVPLVLRGQRLSAHPLVFSVFFVIFSLLVSWSQKKYNK